MKSAITLYCPSCGAGLSVDEDREQTFCIYCGTKITLKDQNEKTTRHINEADVIRAKTEREIAMQELAQKELEQQRERSKLPLYIVWGVLSFLCAALGFGIGNSISNMGLTMVGYIGVMSGLFCLVTATKKNNAQQSENKSNNSKINTSTFQQNN